MFYTIYKITNKLNNKYYIGKHQTKYLDDGYMGSGKILKRAIIKHGIENFTKEILFIFETEQEMNNKEKELVVVSEETYNLCEGGKGGFGFINATVSSDKKQIHKAREIFVYKIKNDPDFREKIIKQRKKSAANSVYCALISKGLKHYYSKNKSIWIGKTHKEETKTKIGDANKKLTGERNGSYGSCWITNGKENKRIKKELLEHWYQQGYTKGRIILPL